MKYHDMVEEVDRRLGEDDFTSRAADATVRAWDYLSRQLRTSEMLKTLAVTTSAEGTFSIPEGFEEGFFMALDRRDPPGSEPVIPTPDTVGEVLPYQPQEYTLANYRGYSVLQDSDLATVVTAVQDTPVWFRYYQKFPVPSPSVPDTDLLQKQPDLCVSALLMQGSIIFNNETVFASIAPYLGALVEDVQDANDRRRYAGVRIQRQLGPRLPLRFFLQ